jgi:hypothetical protein
MSQRSRLFVIPGITGVYVRDAIDALLKTKLYLRFRSEPTAQRPEALGLKLSPVVFPNRAIPGKLELRRCLAWY